MTNQYIDKRQNTSLRLDFDKAFNDLSIILPCYSEKMRLAVIMSYLKAYRLLEGYDGAKGRLIVKLGI